LGKLVEPAGVPQGVANSRSQDPETTVVLDARRQGKDLLISWRSSGTLEHADSGWLDVNDGGKRTQFLLEMSQLASGEVRYAPTSDTIAVRLEIATSGRTIRDSFVLVDGTRALTNRSTGPSLGTQSVLSGVQPANSQSGPRVGPESSSGMYENFYGLNRCPFALTLDPDLLYATPQHREALAALFYGIATNKGLIVLTGDVGTGKTTVLRAALQKLAAAYRERLQYALVVNPHLGTDDLLEFVMTQLGVLQIPGNKAQRLLRLHEFLLSSKRAGKMSTIIVDEAHRLTPDLLEEIRLWTNFETSNAKLVQVVLSGQPELASLLDRSDLRQVKQRVSLRVSLNPLTAAEVQAYLEHRWKKAGGTTLPFTPDAVESLVHLSKGYPRLLNALCDNALLLGFASSERMIGSVQVLQAAADLDLEADEDRTLAFDAGRFGSNRRGE
jgi:general secretion pathway protein A